MPEIKIPSSQRSHLRRAWGWPIALLTVVGCLLVASGYRADQSDGPRRSLPNNAAETARPPALPRLEEGYMAVRPEQAEAINAEIPFATTPLERARPFLLPPSVTADLAAHQTAIDCLTSAIYYEAAGEPPRGQRAVAQVVLNRVRHPAFPKSICAVVYEGSERSTGCQFSFTCDGSLSRKPDQAGWQRAQGVAIAALAGAVEPSVGMATHYHTRFVVPYWAWTLDKVSLIGAHIFYRWQGYWGRRAAFTGNYSADTAAGALPRLAYEPTNGIGITPDQPVKVPPGSRLLIDEQPQTIRPVEPVGQSSSRLRADEERGQLQADERNANPSN